MDYIDSICNASASILDMTPAVRKPEEGKVVLDYILDNCAKWPNKIFLTQPMGGDEVLNVTFSEFLSESKKMAAYIESLNLPAPSQIAIMSKNCVWWLMADLAIMMSGHCAVPIYPTLTAETVKYTLEHSESKLLFVGKLDTHPWNEMKKGIPAGMSCVSFPICPSDVSYDKWADLIGDNEEIKEIKKRTPEEMATIIYTSGSTGVPKGVMLSFKNLTDTTFGLINTTHATENDRYLSYLPISHGMERWVGECLPFITGLHVFYAESLTTFVQDLNRCQPTLFLSVPRLWTKFQLGVFKKMPPEKLQKLLKIPFISYLVKKKLLKALGLNHVRYAGSGSAPLPPDLLAWYRSLGLELLEGYGMTENFNYSHMSKPGGGRVGYVGEPSEGVEQRIAADGEIQVKSPGMMMGYFKNEEATKETMTEDGWLRTGDKGELDDAGRLKITGRTKEIFKTSKGKYVAPAPIENQYISNIRIELACVGGRGHQAANAILMLSEDAKKEAAESGGKDAIEKELEELIKTVNSGLDDHEKLQFVAVVNDVWEPENGFLTPTNKIKRARIEEEYNPLMEEWYNSKKKVIWHKW
ncbi:long-chain fatty acid CoA synthetase [Skeletonema marinoi]|uniref:Long-chain fatty acid CoA synthetase n=1 Tax=Skeletonema marinoi TaxID=267567 RepID=A0AAD9DA11_9STRA|nr:long-chain fatty acid CoA synthetase [Skeletonema marinoi]